MTTSTSPPPPVFCWRHRLVTILLPSCKSCPPLLQLSLCHRSLVSIHSSLPTLSPSPPSCSASTLKLLLAASPFRLPPPHSHTWNPSWVYNTFSTNTFCIREIFANRRGWWEMSGSTLHIRWIPKCFYCPVSHPRAALCSPHTDDLSWQTPRSPKSCCMTSHAVVSSRLTTPHPRAALKQDKNQIKERKREPTVSGQRAPALLFVRQVNISIWSYAAYPQQKLPSALQHSSGYLTRPSHSPRRIPSSNWKRSSSPWDKPCRG